MSERTIITTIEITKVYKDVPTYLLMDKEERKQAYERLVKNLLDADDVVVTNMQDFVRVRNGSNN